MDIVLIQGDGIGKEISQSVKKVANALQTNINFIDYEAGADYYASHNTLVQEGLLEAIDKYKLVFKGPTATPIGTGFRSINVMLRQKFDTYANVRPVKSIKGIQTPFDNVDMVIIRENSEDLYKGIEYMYRDDVAHGVKVISKSASERIFRYAFDYAKSHHRHKVTCVQKANIMKLTDGLFLNTFKEVAKDYPEIESDTCLVDAFCMKAVTRPSQFDVIVTENLYGDIVSDLTAGLVGGLGFAPSCNVGNNVQIYEAVHGSAPDIAGLNKANPSALLMTLAMLLTDKGEKEKADILLKALYSVIEEGKHTTIDIGGTSTTTEFTDAIIERITHEIN